MPEILRAVAITAENLEMAYGEQVVLDKASLTIHDGDRIGLVGDNGCGKSTFMKILAAIETPNQGEITRRKGLKTGYLPQEFVLNENSSVHDNIMDSAKFITDLLAEYESLPHDSGKSHHLENEITQLGGWNLDCEIDTIMTKLKCPEKETIISQLSGGEKRRVALAKALISKPELLILDEPTNHLDTESIDWLEEYMQNYRGACIFVTHDRYFLDRVTNKIVELNRGVFQSYKGNYSNYLKEKAERADREELVENKRQSFLRKELEWVRRSPKARTTKAQYRVDRYHDVAAQTALEKTQDVELIIPPAARMGNRVVDLDDIGVSFENRTLFEHLSLEIQPASRIGIIGSNGVGKTTLLKTILGINQPTSGTVEISSNTKFNYIDQERLVLNNENTVLEEIGEGSSHIIIGTEQISIWGYLKRFLFADERIGIRVGQLSGGERARLLLAKILKRGGNFIVLDEPTNDLDLSTLRVLENALLNFAGCVLLVSHDRYFLNRICTGIIAFEKNGDIKYHVGNYDHYMSQQAKCFTEKTKETQIKREKNSIPNPIPSPNSSTPRKLKWKEQRELDEMEENIMKLESKIEELHSWFSSPFFFKESPQKIKDVQVELDESEIRLNQLYLRWDELESIKNGTLKD
ncbi:MAG: ABC transporter [Lentisphaerae bacterium GWF2_45_14]|nr:MAG: ABC transporter [Lentisphaerae bacterium GWF2_45_14]